MDGVYFAAVKIIVGLVGLVIGGEMLVRGASALAAAVRISPLVIGLTVVAFGTSAPELAVSIQSAWEGVADLAVGNAVGSNIFNVLFILGLSSLITPLIVSSQLIRWDVPLMIVAALMLPIFGFDGRLGRVDGIIMFSCLVVYIVWLVRKSRQEPQAIQEEYARENPVILQPTTKTYLIHVGFLVGGFVLLCLGSSWLVDGSVFVARIWGVSELIIGLTIVSVGTSLPEVVTSIIASMRGERDIAVGNVVGSNIFNMLCVLGLSSIVAPNGVAISSAALHFDIPVMIAVCIACLPIFFTGYVIARWEGALFLGYYFAYTTYLILDAMQNELSRTLGNVMIYFVIPLTVITLIVGVYRHLRWPDGVRA